MVDRKRQSRHEIGNGNGNGNGDDDDLGEKLQQCNLATECPFEPALERLADEQHDRIKAESVLAATIDAVADKAQKASLQLESFARSLRDFEHDFARHLRHHRYFDLAVMSIGATIGGFLAKLVTH